MAIDEIKALADKAGSELVIITLPEKISGVPHEVPAFVDRESGTINSVKSIIDQYRTAPERKSGTAKTFTLESFIDLVNRHKTEDTVIFANTNWQKPSLTAVIDYHKFDSTEADNLKHRVSYDFPLSEEWEAWINLNNKPLSQSDFAEFIEDHISDLSGPDDAEELEYQQKFSFKVAFPNQLVELSRGLQVNADTRVKNVVSLQNGTAQIVFEEEHQTLDKQGNRIDVPGMFILSVPPFFGGETARIPVRLRYKKTPSGVVWLYQLYRPEFYVTEQVRRDLTRAAAETELPHFEGTPETTA
ncbi:DUF2303 family protein [Agrobacterium sp. AGB01]|nr:DUF2303 family protein [Agrobacterium sp. AGB01]